MKVLCFYIFILFTLLFNISIASVPLVLDDAPKAIFKGKYVDVLEDKTNSLTIKEIFDPLREFNFVQGKEEDVYRTKNTNSTYWIRLKVIDKLTLEGSLVIELHDFRIAEFEIFIPDTSGFKSHSGGYSYPFSKKVFQHKNFVFYLNIPKNKLTTIYIKIKTTEPAGIIGSVKTFAEFNSYSTNEYLLLSIFYGIAIAMILYNLFLAFALKDRTYLFYVLYVFCIIFYTLTQDGLGFQYLWPEYPWFNKYSARVSNYFVIVTALIYARSFLNTKKYLGSLDKILFILILARTFIFLLSVKYNNDEHVKHFDLIGFAYIYILSIIQLKRGHTIARFYVLAFTFLLIGYNISFLVKYNLVEDTPITVYGFNMAVLLEMITLALALADRIKLLTTEKEKAQREIIRLKDTLNEELEVKVIERTKELDNFVYRSSHDIKGPLKSIIGLAITGIKDVQDKDALVYFEHILKSSNKLDGVVDHLLNVIQFKEVKLVIKPVEFKQCITEVLSSFEGNADYQRLNISLNIQQNAIFYTDPIILTSIFQNLIDNAIKYQDFKKEKSLLTITLNINDEKAYVKITDNGLGINKLSQEKIFDIFYKTNPGSSGKGIGLYIVKVSVEKLGGSMRLVSEEGKGSTFSFSLKNM